MLQTAEAGTATEETSTLQALLFPLVFLYVAATDQSQTRYESKQTLMSFHIAILMLDTAYDQVGFQICSVLIITKI